VRLASRRTGPYRFAPFPASALACPQPLTYPNKVICAGANYYDHAAEMGVERPDPAADPFFFLKAPTTTVIGSGAIVATFNDARSQVDWEAELAVAIGRRCTDVDAVGAAIAGYLVANDISDRGIFHRSGSGAALRNIRCVG
jgi:2-keto-4-pentenoate hydratase/2-oxohepta-3-ene-1,7-dioic acid hydratase in catechol pathway